MFRESEKNQKKKQSEKLLNKIQARTQQLSQILQKNNSLFIKGLPSKDRMIKILEHCYNCYDQLDYIMLQNTQNALAYVEPKKTAEQAHKIIRTTKYMMNNVKCWMQSSLNTFDSNQENISCFFPQRANHQPQCSSCNCYLEALIVKQAKQEIFGYQRVKQEFQLEMRSQKNQKMKEKTPQLNIQSTQYVSSVNFLTKIIKQMEQSALTYDQLAQKIEKDEAKQNLGIKYLQQLLSNLKVRLGYRCIQTLRKVIKSWENDEALQNNCQKVTRFNLTSKIIHEVISPKNPIRNTFNRQQELLIKKLKSDLSNLQIQRNYLLQTFRKLNNNLNSFQINQQTNKKQLEKQINAGILDKFLSTKVSLIQHDNFSRNTQQGNHLGKIKAINQHQRMLAQRKRGFFSKFSVQRFSKQQQGEKANEDNTVDETEVNNTLVQAQQGQLQEYQKYITQFKDVGCQYQAIIREQKYQEKETTEKKPRNSKLKKIMQRPSTKKNLKPKEISTNEPSTGQIFQNRKSTNKSLKSFALLQRQKNIDPNQRFSMQQSKVPSKSLNKVNPTKYLQSNIRTQPIQEENENFNRMITSDKNLQEQILMNQQQQGNKINIYSSNRLRELNLTSNSIRQSSNILTVGTFKQNYDGLIKKKSQKKPNRLSPQEKQFRKKIRLVRNILFKPQHLSLFGGVSESYSYERYIPEKRELNPEQRQYFQSLSLYLQNLQNFKSSVFQNVVLFLSNPFEFIDKNEIEFKQIGIKKLEKILLKFICFHSKKCKHLNCSHIISFNILIGLLQRS